MTTNDTEIVGEGAEPTGLGSPARAREELATRAASMFERLGRPPTPRERFWFVFDAWRDGLVERGVSSPIMAEAWGCATNTVERSVCEVKNAMTDPAGVERNREEILWESRRRSDELYERSKLAADRDAAALASAAGKELDRWAAASGAIDQKPLVQVTVENIAAVQAIFADRTSEAAKQLRQAQHERYLSTWLGAIDRGLAMLGASDAQRRHFQDRVLADCDELDRSDFDFDDTESWRMAKEWAAKGRLGEGR